MSLSLVTETLFFFFFKKLKHKRKLKKLQTDLATTKQEAAITVLELNEKIKALCEGKPAPRGQYHHVTVTGPWSQAVYIVIGNQARSKATVPGIHWPGSMLTWPDLHSAWMAISQELLTPDEVPFTIREAEDEWISSSLKESLWSWRAGLK